MLYDRTLTHLSLFSGIGGLDLAAEAAGFTTVGQCEWADYPTKVLEKHWPDVPRWRDIRTLTKESFHEKTGLWTVDVVSGGFPCQPFSCAGKQRSTDDDRYLWPEMLRVIHEIRPSWVLGENVPGIVNLALDKVLSDLGNEGYESQCFIVPACGVDAPHKRSRITILANYTGKRHGFDRSSNDASETGGQGSSDTGRKTANDLRQWGEDKSRVCRVVDGIQTEVYGTSSNAGCQLLQRCSDEQMVFTECSSRERESRRRYRGRLDEFLECTPLGKIGLMNPAWTEWLMGYPIGWTELDA